jgi:hypothetical protein
MPVYAWLETFAGGIIGREPGGITTVLKIALHFAADGHCVFWSTGSLLKRERATRMVRRPIAATAIAMRNRTA